MSIVEEYQEKHRIGFPTFKKLFNLKMDKLIEVLKDVCADHKEASEVLNEKPNSYKFIENDEPTKIKLCSFLIRVNFVNAVKTNSLVSG